VPLQIARPLAGVDQSYWWYFCRSTLDQVRHDLSLDCCAPPNASQIPCPIFTGRKFAFLDAAKRPRVVALADRHADSIPALHGVIVCD